MAAVGYSGTPLIKKPGIRPEMKLLLYNPPDNYFDLLETGIRKQVIESGTADWAHIFVTSKKN